VARSIAARGRLRAHGAAALHGAFDTLKHLVLPLYIITETGQN
jgi:hypothetical protein